MNHRLFDLNGKTALVTGGAQGLGRMIAEGLLQAGAKVYITSRNTDVCNKAADEMSRIGTCIPMPADLTTAEAAVELSDRLAKSESALNILVNNAGKTWGAKLEDFPDKAWPGVMAVNVQAPFTLVRQLLPMLTSAGTPVDPARVINIGSVAGIRVMGLDAFSYSASKAALHQLSRELAATLGGKHITVNALVPGYFPTQMTAHVRKDEEQLESLTGDIPLRRLGTPEDIAGACIFLSSRAGAYVTGAELHVDGGLVGCR